MSETLLQMNHIRKHFGNVHLRLARLEIIFQVSQKIKVFIC